MKSTQRGLAVQADVPSAYPGGCSSRTQCQSSSAGGCPGSARLSCASSAPAGHITPCHTSHHFMSRVSSLRVTRLWVFSDRTSSAGTDRLMTLVRQVGQSFHCSSNDFCSTTHNEAPDQLTKNQFVITFRFNGSSSIIRSFWPRKGEPMFPHSPPATTEGGPKNQMGVRLPPIAIRFSLAAPVYQRVL